MSAFGNEECFWEELMIFDKVVEKTDEWWLSPDKEEGVRSRLVWESIGGLEIDRMVGQINEARFMQFKGEEVKHKMAYRNPIGGWFR